MGRRGQGKIVDVLSEKFSVVARYAGGHNAGHTVIISGKKFVLQLITCGVLRPDTKGVFGNGVVLDPMAFLSEVKKLRDAGLNVDGQLFVTSSSATAGGAVIGTGVGPTKIGTVIGVTKAYVTRVGEGPFPTEIHDESATLIRARGQEYGAVTGRPRRCGWLDLPLLRYSNMINGTEWLVVTKMDVLDQCVDIPVCTR